MHISISEILVILIVALLVIKPENLPTAAFTAGRWLKWFRQTAVKIKQEMEAPLALSEPKNQNELKNE